MLAVLVGTVIILVAGRVASCREPALVLTHPHPFWIPRLFSFEFRYNPVVVFDRLFLGALGDPLSPGWSPLDGQIAVTLRETTVLVFTGLSVALAFRAGIFNIGTQGQLVVGALATALAVLWAAPLVSGVVGTVLPVPLWLAVGAVFGGPNSEGVRTPPTLAEVVGGVPIVGDVQATLAAIPFLGALFDANVTVYLTFLMVALSWYALYRTRFGRWVRASGENPGRSTRRASASVASGTSLLLSGVLSGMGGASLSLSLSQFTGNGATMVNGKGFVAIVAYLFGNYNPVGAFLSTLLFAGLDAIQNALQIEGVGVPGQLVRITPFVMVIVVLALVGRTQLPDATGEHYESGGE